MDNNKYSLAIHGGCAILKKQFMTPELEQAFRDKLLQALSVGEAVLKANGTSLDAVEAAVKVMEDSELFNAGKGSVFTAEGTNEMDASIMEGNTRKAGSVAGTTRIKNPISAARKVMEKCQHVMLSGEGANQFAAEQGLQIVQPSYFYTERRYNQLLLAKQQNKCILGHDEFIIKPSAPGMTSHKAGQSEAKLGTVGAVALDTTGNVAAATSTGGMSNKKYGRIGDSPIIGAGCYANNKTCAVSSTGEGEFFIRGVVAYDISAIMQFSGACLEEAANKVIHQRLLELGGRGGVIAVDHEGSVCMPFNTQGMYRGYVKHTGEKRVMIEKQE